MINYDVAERDCWYLDSGASYHIIARREWFNTFEEPMIIRVGNGARISATGRGDIRIEVFNGQKWIENI